MYEIYKFAKKDLSLFVFVIFYLLTTAFWNHWINTVKKWDFSKIESLLKKVLFSFFFFFFCRQLVIIQQFDKQSVSCLVVSAETGIDSSWPVLLLRCHCRKKTEEARHPWWDRKSLQTKSQRLNIQNMGVLNLLIENFNDFLQNEKEKNTCKTKQISERNFFFSIIILKQLKKGFCFAHCLQL